MDICFKKNLIVTDNISFGSSVVDIAVSKSVRREIIFPRFTLILFLAALA